MPVAIIVIPLICNAQNNDNASNNQDVEQQAELQTGKPNNAAHADDNTASNEKGTKQNPVVIAAPSPNSSNDTAKQEKHDELNVSYYEVMTAKSTRALALITGILALATIILAIFTYKLWKTTSDLAGRSEDIGKKQLRAYLGANRGRLVIQGKNNLRGEVIITNKGTTPAKDMRWVIKGDRGTQATIGDFCDLDFLPHKEPVPPNNERIIGYDFPQFTDDEMRLIMNQNLLVYVWGKVEYLDVFNERHIVKFRYRNVVTEFTIDAKGERVITGWKWYPESEGNEAT